MVSHGAQLSAAELTHLWYCDMMSTIVACAVCACRWLDEGEDDGKIVRELRVQDEYMDDILEKRNVCGLVYNLLCV